VWSKRWWDEQGKAERIAYADGAEKPVKLSGKEAEELEKRLTYLRERGIMEPTTKISMQYFAKKSEDFATVILSKDEYAHVMSELATNLTEEQATRRVFRKYIDDYVYLVENNGFGNYRIIGKEKIK
jgi:hypothetical protein